MKHIIISVELFFFAWAMAAALFLLFLHNNAQGAAAGPLRVLTSNPRYFTDGSGKAVYLTGSHNSNGLQDSGTFVGGPIANILDYNAYLDFMVSHNHNFTRMWMYEAGEHNGYYEPVPWLRDTAQQYDLHQFNQAYFDRLRQRMSQANARGIYVSVMLFQGFSYEDKGYGNPWPIHPFNANNNITGTDGDLDGDGQGVEFHTLQSDMIRQLQEEYVRKVIDTVNDLDNVLYEISNEDTASAADTQWQYYMINYIKLYEAGKAKQHPVGMTFQSPGGSNQTLVDSPADWISPGGYEYLDDPPAADGSKVIISDNDHISPDGVDQIWIWKSFMRGFNPIYLGHYDATDPAFLLKANGAWTAMGSTLTFANKMNLAAMTSRGDLASTGYALARPGSQYLMYQPGSGTFSVDLRSGTYQVEWFNPSSGQTLSGGTVSGGGSHSFTPPFSGSAVLYLKVLGGGAAPTPTPHRRIS
jgi:Family of unknown function (DUF6298)/Putative collagen-binding domain of a collagenase